MVRQGGGASPSRRLRGRVQSLRRHVRGGFSATTLKTQDLHQLAHGTPGGAVSLRPSATPADMRKWRKDAKNMRGAGKPPDPWCEAVFVGAKIIEWPPRTWPQVGRSLRGSWRSICASRLRFCRLSSLWRTCFWRFSAATIATTVSRPAPKHKRGSPRTRRNGPFASYSRPIGAGCAAVETPQA